MGRAAAGASLASAALAALVACGKASPTAEPVPAGLAVVDGTATVRHGAVGGRVNRQDTTYVLVDVENDSGTDRVVAVDGTLKDAAGKDLGPLAVDEMRVPAGQIRTFALLFTRVAREGAGAAVRVRRAEAVTYPEPVTIALVEAARDGDVYAVTARAKNTLARHALATVCATFYDAGGAILARPFIGLELDPSASRPYRFDGPKEAVRAAVFVYEVTF